jgi:hypothetical protein
MVDFFLTRIGVTLGEGVDGDCLEAGRISFGVVGAGLSGLESRRLKAFVISLSPRFKLMLFTDPRSMLLSLSVPFWPSHGFAAIQRSNQLQPHCRLFGSTNIGLADLEVLFHCNEQNETL